MPTAPETETSEKHGGVEKPDWAKSGRERSQKRRRRWPLFLLLIVIVAGLGYFVWIRSQQPVPAEGEAMDLSTQAALQINPDERAELAPRMLQRTVKVIGTLHPSRSTQLSSQTTGRIEEVAAQPGDRVKGGDLLVQVDIETLTLDRDLAQSNANATAAQLSLAETQYERTQALVARGVTTASNLDEARTNLAGLRANLDAQKDQIAVAELHLRNATLRAPFDGIISARNVEPGQFVSVGTQLMTVVDLSTVEMRANAAVGSGALLEPGQRVIVQVDGISDQDFEGVVARINPVADAESRTIPVYVTIDNADGTLLGGMFATGQIIVDKVDDAIAVPSSALREDAEGLHVLRIENDKLLRQAVETAGSWTGRLVQITSGLEAGQMVVTAPLTELWPGDAIELVGN